MVSLKDRLQSELTDAMRARDDVRVSTLRLALTAITKAEVAGKEQAELSDDDIVGILRTEVRKRTEAADMYASAGRDELAQRERAQAGALSPYLPAELSDDALRAIVDEEVARAASDGVQGGKAMGVVVKAVRARVGNEAPGGRVADAVKTALGL